jgi:hypothetical protein
MFDHSRSWSDETAARLRKHPPGSREHFRELAKIGVELAEHDARRALTLKTLRATGATPAVVRAVGLGKLSLAHAKRALRLTPDQQDHIAAAAEAGWNDETAQRIERLLVESHPITPKDQELARAVHQRATQEGWGPPEAPSAPLTSAPASPTIPAAKMAAAAPGPSDFASGRVVPLRADNSQRKPVKAKRNFVSNIRELMGRIGNSPPKD